LLLVDVVVDEREEKQRSVGTVYTQLRVGQQIGAVELCVKSVVVYYLLHAHLPKATSSV